MKRSLMLLLTFFSLFFISAGGSKQGSDEITVEGTVYLWTLDYAHDATAKMSDFDEIPGGRYRTAPNLYVEVEFGWLNRDQETRTDDYGRYRITKGNPWLGSYSVDVEVRANVMPDKSGYEGVGSDINMFPAGADLFFFYEGRLNTYPYNGQTNSILVGDDETVTMDVYIGGPGRPGGYLITDWWDDYPGDHLIGFYSVEVIRDAYRWAVDRSIPAVDIKRETSLMYPIGDDLEYKPFTPPPGVGHINVSRDNLYPDEVLNPQRIGEDWQDLSGSLTHEYGHKIMHDVYTVLPMGFQEPLCTGHTIGSTITGECGLMEGWALFFAAAVRNRSTVNGGLGASNLEHTFHPDPGRITTAGQGSFTWRDDVADGEQAINEGENAAVLWDIYDAKGWEYMLPAQQDAAKVLAIPWPVPLRWYERLNDSQLTDIWTILREDDPDRLTDEGALFDVTNDGFWEYWRDHFSSDGEKIHGLKAILYNREIDPAPYSETAPTIQVLSIDWITRTAQVKITEADEEDRPYLYYNIAYRNDDIPTLRLIQYADKLVADQVGIWQGDTLMVEITIPPFQAVRDMVFMVHDSMQAGFTSYWVDAGGSGGWQELTLTNGGNLAGSHAGGRMIERDGLLYVAALNDGLRIYDLRAHPEEPVEVDAITSPGFFAWSIKLEGDFIYIAGAENIYTIDVSRPSAPRVASSLIIEDVLLPHPDVFTLGLDYHDGFLYHTGGYEGLYTYQSNTDGQLTAVGKYEHDDCRMAENIIVYSHTIYLVCQDKGLQILDISIDPTNPKLVGTWQVNTLSDHGRSLITDIKLDTVNKRLYLGSFFEGAVYVLDISNPQVPRVQAVIKTTGNVNGLSVSDNILYTIESGPWGMTAIYIHNINEPVELAYLEMEGGATNILVVGDYAYIGHDNGYLSLVEIGRP